MDLNRIHRYVNDFQEVEDLVHKLQGQDVMVPETVKE